MRSTVSRRGFLGAGLAVGAALTVAGCGTSVRTTPPVPRWHPAARPLAIPPLVPSRRDAAGRRVIDLVAAPGTSTFADGVTTPTWGYGGMPFGGPTLRAVRGEDVVVRVTNRLPETTTTHWHGMTLPARADGGPHQPIAPGATWEASWRVDQPAATLWDHPHPHGATGRHVHRGLAGLFLIDDGPTPGLPQRYGVDDVPVIVTDRSFAPDGSFDTAHRNAHGLLGDTVLVNGTVRAHLDVVTERVRLRLLNASSARSYRFGFDDGPLTLVGTDLGLLVAPWTVDDVLLTPGERAEVVVDVAPGGDDGCGRSRTTWARRARSPGRAEGRTPSTSWGCSPAAVLELSPPVTATLSDGPALREAE